VNKTKVGDNMGVHIIADCWGIDPDRLSRVKEVKGILDRVISLSGLTCVKSVFYQFKPYGVTCIYLLKESHLSIHTWPEKGFMNTDIFTCGEDKNAFKAFELILKFFEPKKVKKKIIKRET